METTAISRYLALTLLLVSMRAYGYTTATHATMTALASRQSQITGDPVRSALIRKLGLTEIIARSGGDPFHTTTVGDYIVQTAKAQWLSGGGEFEKTILGDVRRAAGDALFPADSSITGWMMRGAIREDDNPKETPDSDEPGGVMSRVYGHFYDPQNDKSIFIGTRTPDWAAERNTIMNGHLNLYSVRRARDAMWCALTWPRSDALCQRPENSNPLTTDWEIRKGYWAMVFRSLGDVVHLIQDMAQPQHTRLEFHSGYSCVATFCIFGHDSFYEKYIDARVLKRGSFTLDEGFLSLTAGEPISINQPPLAYGAYEKPRLTNYRDFFSTGSGSEANAAGRGLANYSNRGFYSARTNIGLLSILIGYPSPNPSGNGLNREILVGTGLPGSPVTDIGGRPVNGTVTFLNGDVQDNFRGSPDRNVRLSTVGMWDQFLRTAGGGFTLNHYNYNAMADLLIPRAIGYSAGLLDFFFRGEMQISLPDEGVYSAVDQSKVHLPDPTVGSAGFNKIRLKLANLTPNGEPMPGGTVVAVLKFHRNKCYSDDLMGYPPFADWSQCRDPDEEIVVSNPLTSVALTAIAQQMTFDFTKPLPINATDVQLQVVYSGALGTEEDAVVVATKDISEPTFFSYQNASDYILISNKVYTRNELNAAPDLLAKVQPQSLVDYSQSPPRLKSTSLQPFPLSLDLTFDSQHLTSIAVDSLQPGEYIRIAILGEPRLPESAPTPNFIVGRDTVQQCLPNTFKVTPVNWQDTYDADTNTLTTYYPEFSKVRGIAGWAFDSCVVNGDSSPPGGFDDRTTKMIPAPYDNPQPVAVVINGGAGF